MTKARAESVLGKRNQLEKLVRMSNSSTKNGVLTGTRFAQRFEQRNNHPTEATHDGVFMANETELFYLVLLVVLTVVIHVILAASGSRRGGKTRP